MPTRKDAPPDECVPEEISYCWYSRQTYVYGWGNLPSSQVVFRASSVRLHAMVDAATFSITRCTIDEGNAENPYVCTEGGEGGTIDATWTKDKSGSMSSSGVTQQNYGRYSFKTNGTYRSAQATADGSLLGTPFVNAWGAMSDSRGVSISKDVTTNPDL